MALRISVRRRGRVGSAGARLTCPDPELPPLLVSLDDEAATDPGLAGRKAANLATARSLGFSVLPGFVVTTAACAAMEGPVSSGLPPLLAGCLHKAWSELSAGGERLLVVRSSSPGEDGDTSSMAGQFMSVLGVRTWPEFLAAVEAVIESGPVGLPRRADEGSPAMAVLIQPQVFPTWGGVLFGVDPVTGRTDRRVIAAVDGGPDQLVSGTVDGVRYTVSRHGRVLASDGEGLAQRLPVRQRRALARLAARAAGAFGGDQDIEWAYVDGRGLLLLQTRPVTAVGVAAEPRGPVLGPGPVAETFPDPLAPLERDLWLPPLRQALAEAMRLTGAASRRRLRGSPVVASVGGRVAADLGLLGVLPGSRSLWSRFDPRPPARRARAAWRTGRLRAALPVLARDVVRRADEELASVPAPTELADAQLLGLLRGSRQALLAIHGYEILAGMLASTGDSAPTSAAAALSAVVDGRARGLDDDAILAHHPVALSLLPPSMGPRPPLPAVAAAGMATAPPGDVDELSERREELRLRARWVQELTARVAGELGARLARRDLLPAPEAVRWLSAEELEAAVEDGRVPDDVGARAAVAWPAPLPAAFRLTSEGLPVAVQQGGGGGGGGQGAGGGRAHGRVHQGDGPVRAGDVLVVRTLDPGLAAVLPGLGGLVAETGSVLSHLAILARELGIPTVVGVADALARFQPGSVVVVDGVTGEVSPVEATEVAS